MQMVSSSVDCVGGTAFLSLTLLSPEQLNVLPAYSIPITNGIIAEAEPVSTTSPSSPSTTEPFRADPTMISAVAASVFVLLIVVVALLLTVLLSKCRRHHWYVACVCACASNV